MIRSKNIEIHETAKIADDVEILASDSVKIGPYAVIQSGFKAVCRSLTIGTHCFIAENCEVGGGGCYGPNAHFHLDDYAGLMAGVYVNCAEPVKIGKYCGVGQETKIWTHGVWLDIKDGFPPQKQAPVTIGDKVWIPARIQILAGVTIGDNVVIGINSIVNKDLPSGCFAAGMPVKILRENVYPNDVSPERMREILTGLIDEYAVVAEEKGFSPTVTIEDGEKMKFSYEGEEVIFDPWKSTFSPCPDISEFAEDFRDYMRRNGVKFYGGGLFRSILPKRFADLNV